VCEKVSMHLVNNILVGGLRNSSDADDGWIVDETPMIGRRARAAGARMYVGLHDLLLDRLRRQ
jgi:hypothetical protein